MVVASDNMALAADAELAQAFRVAAAVLDPEVPVITLAELGVLRGVSRRRGTVVVTLTPTYTGCPATAAIQLLVETALLEAGIGTAQVETVLAPPWTTDDISESGRAKLKAYGIAPPHATPPDGLFANDVVDCPRCGSFQTTKLSEFGSTPCKAQWRCDDCREPFDYFKCHR
jgi:ring-1,2-phenylacetyl-CoA epoxidase subunit PaaD